MASTTPDTLIVGVPNRIELQDLYDLDTDAPITTATVTHTLRTADGDIVTGETARACAHVTGGTYRATFPDDLAIIAGRAYRGTYVADRAGVTYEFAVDYIATQPAP